MNEKEIKKRGVKATHDIAELQSIYNDLLALYHDPVRRPTADKLSIGAQIQEGRTRLAEEAQTLLDISKCLKGVLSCMETVVKLTEDCWVDLNKRKEDD